MKFFLPALYVQLNSPDDEMADAAEEALDRASDRYNQHWAKIKRQLPQNVVCFGEKLSLHDADVFTPAVLSQPMGSWGVGEMVLVAQMINTLDAEFLNSLAFLHYKIRSEPQILVPVHSEVLSPTQPTWLYDEFDLVSDGGFSHEIFLSDGRVIRIVFHEFDWHIAKLVTSPARMYAGLE